MGYLKFKFIIFENFASEEFAAVVQRKWTSKSLQPYRAIKGGLSGDAAAGNHVKLFHTSTGLRSFHKRHGPQEGGIS
jgi:peroxiredoxin family protein